MSAASVRFSSSSRSIRSMNERSRSPAIPPTSGIVPPTLYACVLRLRRGEGRLLLGGRLLLVLLAPFVIRHAVDDLARLGVAERDALFLGRGAVPFRQAVAAESGEVHQVDVLHVGALAQMRDQRAERRCFEFGAGLVVHVSPPLLPPYVALPEAILNASRMPRRNGKIAAGRHCRGRPNRHASLCARPV